MKGFFLLGRKKAYSEVREDNRILACPYFRELNILSHKKHRQTIEGIEKGIPMVSV